MFNFFKRFKKNDIGEVYSCRWWMNQANKAHMENGMQLTAAFLNRLERQGKIEPRFTCKREGRRNFKFKLFAPASGFSDVEIREELVKAFSDWEKKVKFPIYMLN